MESRPAPIAERAEVALEVPLQRALDAQLLDAGDPSAGVSFVVAGLARTPMGTLHAGALSGVLELAGYLAVLPQLSDGEHAITHAISAQFVSPAHDGESVAVVGRLLRRGRSVAFVHAVATVGSRVVAEAQITKSVISAR